METVGSPGAKLAGCSTGKRCSQSRSVAFIGGLDTGEITTAVAFLRISRVEALVELIKLGDSGPKIKTESGLRTLQEQGLTGDSGRT